MKTDAGDTRPCDEHIERAVNVARLDRRALSCGEHQARVRPPVASSHSIRRLLRPMPSKCPYARLGECDDTSGVVSLGLVVSEFSGHSLQLHRHRDGPVHQVYRPCPAQPSPTLATPRHSLPGFGLPAVACSCPLLLPLPAVESGHAPLLAPLSPGAPGTTTAGPGINSAHRCANRNAAPASSRANCAASSTLPSSSST